MSNARYAVRDGDRGEGGAIIESRIPNARYTVRDGDGGEGGAFKESFISNARYAVRDNRALTTSNQCIGCRFNNRIAVVAAIVDGITLFNYHRGEGGARKESSLSNARYALGDGDGGEGGATRESIISNARYAIRDSNGGEGGAPRESIISNARDAVRDGDRGEGGTIRESIISNARDAVRDSDRGEGGAIHESLLSNARDTIDCAIMGDGSRDGDFAIVFVRVFINRTSLVSYCDVVVGKVVVIDAIYFEVMCPEACGSKKCPEKKKKFSHNR